MAEPLRTLAGEYYPEPPALTADATILAFPQPDTTSQAVFVSESDITPDVNLDVAAAMQRVKAAEHVARIVCGAVSAQLHKEPHSPLSHPLRTWRYERRLIQLQTRKDIVTARLQQAQLALATLQYGRGEYAPDVWQAEEAVAHSGTGLLRRAIADHLISWVKAGLA